MMSFPSSSKSLTSTPLKCSSGEAVNVLQRSSSLDCGSDSTSSLISPIYHDSFEEDEQEDQFQPIQRVSITINEDVASVSSSRDEVDSTGLDDRLSSSQLKLSAWEQWIVDKAREDRLRKQQKAMEELTLKEKEKKREKDQQKKKVVSDCRIQQWLQIKQEQEKKDKLSKESQKSLKELEEEKRRAEIERKARNNYKEWLRQKKHEETERKLKEKEEAARREAEERQRREKAEESFKEWLDGVKTKQKVSRQSSACLAGNYNNVNYPSPSFVNPIPWKPIHVPQQDRTAQKSSTRRRTTGPAKSQSSPCLAYRPKDTLSFAYKRR